MPIHSKDIAPLLGHVEQATANPNELRDLGHDCLTQPNTFHVHDGEPHQVVCNDCGRVWDIVEK